MLNKLNTKSLLFLLVVLVAIVVIVKMRKSDAPKSALPNSIVQADTAAIDRLVVNPKGESPYELLRKNGVWKLKLENGKEVACESKMVNNSFGALTNTAPKRIITRKPENWGNYEVNDSLSIKITFYKGNEELAGLYIGRFDFNQQTSSMSNFVRIANTDDVLLCDAPLSFDWGKKQSDWRNKTVLSTNKASISKVSGSGQLNFSMVKDDLSGWVTQGVTMDSTAIDAYLGALSNLSSKAFDDEMNLTDLGTPIQTVEIYTELEDFTLSLYNTPNGQRLHSTANTQNVFVADSVMIGKLIPMNEELVGAE